MGAWEREGRGPDLDGEYPNEAVCKQWMICCGVRTVLVPSAAETCMPAVETETEGLGGRPRESLRASQIANVRKGSRLGRLIAAIAGSCGV